MSTQPETMTGPGDAVEPGTSGEIPAALRSPATPVRAGWVALLSLAILGVFMGFFAPIQFLLPQQIAGIDPAHKETLLGWVTGIGAFAAMVVNPLVGALSDRTSGRFGRRHPWTLLGALTAVVALVGLSRQHSVIGIAVFWILAQTALNVMLAALAAAVPDRVPVRQRGAVSGWVGIPQVLGLVVGVILVTSVVQGVQAGYVAVAIGVFALAAPFVFATRDDPLPRSHRAPLAWRKIFAEMWISPRRYPDFAWAWLTRFLVNLGNAIGTLYLLYFLTDAVHYPHPADGLLVLILIYTAAITLTTVIFGAWSDRSGRRRVFVVVAGLVIAFASLMLSISPTWITAMAAAAVLGAGFGIYLSVDNALVTQVLPANAERAKDLGVINIAASAPQVLAPALAAPIVRSLGGYPVLYAVAALVTVLGGVLVLRIRSVR